MKALIKNPVVISTIAVAVLAFFIWGLQMIFQSSLRLGIIIAVTSFVILVALLSYDFVLYKRQLKNKPLMQEQKDKLSEKTKERTDMKTRKQAKPTIAGFVLHNNGEIKDCHSDMKIIIKGKPEDVNVAGFIGEAGENSEVEGCSDKTEIEYKQD